MPIDDKVHVTLNRAEPSPMPEVDTKPVGLMFARPDGNDPGSMITAPVITPKPVLLIEVTCATEPKPNVKVSPTFQLNEPLAMVSPVSEAYAIPAAPVPPPPVNVGVGTV